MAIKDRLYDVPVVGTALRVQDRYQDDGGNQLAAAMGFFGFLSLFPLLLLALSVAGFVLADDPGRQAEIVSTIENAIPGLGAAAGGEGEQTVVGQAMESITSNPGAVGLVGLVTLLLAGLRVVDSAMAATEQVFHVRVEEGPVKKKLRQLGALTGLGLLALAGAVASSSVGALVQNLSAPLSTVAGIVAPLVSLALDVALFLVAYRVLAAGQGPAWRELVPGALLAGIGWTALKIFGATYVSSQVARANELYGTLGGVIGLMLLLFLAGRLYVYGAELTSVRRDPGGDMARRDPDVHRVVQEERDLVAGGGVPSADAGEPAGVATLPGEADAPLAEPTVPPDRLPGTVERTLLPPTEEHRVTDEPLPPPPTPEQPSPAVSATTATRLQHADARNQVSRDPNYVRKGLAFAIAVGAVGGLVAVMRPGGDDR